MRPPVRILAYHSLAAFPGDPLGVAPEEFRRQMDWLARRGWQCMPLREWVGYLERGEHPRRPSFVLTFDDGYADCLETAAPILQEHGWRATVFVVTGALREGRPLEHDRDLARGAGAPRRRSMTWDEAASLRDLGFDIGSHTCHHARLTCLDPAARRYELVASREELKSRLNVPADLFCYPRGEVDGRIVAEVRAAGYRGAVVTTRFAGVPRSPWTMHRIGIYGHDDASRFRFKLGPLFPCLRLPRLMLTSRGERFGPVPRLGPVRVLQVTSSSDLGGIERMMERLVPALRAEGVQADVLALRRGGAAEALLATRGIPLHGLGPNGLPGQILALRRQVELGGYDVLHTYGTRALVVSRLAAALLGRRRPRVLTGILSTVWAHGSRRRLLERLTRRWSDLYVSNSRAGADTLPGRRSAPIGDVRRLALPLPPAGGTIPLPFRGGPGIRVIHDGIEDLPHPRAGRSRLETRASLGIGPADPVLICVANLRPMKGHLTLLEALGPVATVHANVRLLLVGEDRMEGRVQRYAADRFAPGTVRFLGLRDDVDDLLGAADVFVLASDWEGLPISLLEAMRASLPPVLTAVSGIPEAIRDRKEGLLVPPGNPESLAGAILELLGHPREAADMGRRARERFLALFRIERMARDLARLYEERAGSARRRAGPSGTGLAEVKDEEVEDEDDRFVVEARLSRGAGRLLNSGGDHGTE